MELDFKPMTSELGGGDLADDHSDGGDGGGIYFVNICLDVSHRCFDSTVVSTESTTRKRKRPIIYTSSRGDITRTQHNIP